MTADERERPLQCPSCSADAGDFRVERRSPGLLGSPRYHLECQRCGLRGPGGKTEKDMVLFWNQIAELRHRPIEAVATAATSDLLEACRLVLHDLDGDSIPIVSVRSAEAVFAAFAMATLVVNPETVDFLRAAIAKATGAVPNPEPKGELNRWR